MIKKLLLLSIPFLLSTHSYSQEHQISAGMGVGSTSQILDAFLKIGNDFKSSLFDSSYINTTENYGEFRLSYFYTPKDRWSYGAAFSLNKTNFDVLHIQEKLGKQETNYYTVAAETSYSFLKRDRLNLYSLFGAGATFGAVKQTEFATGVIRHSDGTIFNIQITPIAVRYGKRFGGFVELGFGYRGLFSFGAFYTL